ncbi:hypothetical protein B0H67DRAFT_114069 [Lasiosphaeris hirsuta]|uniref:Uncharacterized protein n=1 Tax=Lasiosphaeris hirsuta TaxID=260670 RepID=A0AA40AZB9_9PEZI|nr:hypothetical protein B0H67DRAFT_114069 [Lasiosphaeris hirsuta]
MCGHITTSICMYHLANSLRSTLGRYWGTWEWGSERASSCNSYRTSIKLSCARHTHTAQSYDNRRWLLLPAAVYCPSRPFLSPGWLVMGGGLRLQMTGGYLPVPTGRPLPVPPASGRSIECWHQIRDLLPVLCVCQRRLVLECVGSGIRTSNLSYKIHRCQVVHSIHTASAALLPSVPGDKPTYVWWYRLSCLLSSLLSSA